MSSNQHLRTLNDTAILLDGFGASWVRLLLLPPGNRDMSVFSQTPQQHQIVSVSQLLDSIQTSGVHIQGQLVFPDYENASLNPFLSAPVLTLPCYKPTPVVPQNCATAIPNLASFPVEVASANIFQAADFLSETEPSNTKGSVQPGCPKADISDTKKGTSCHQCKNTKQTYQLAFCSKKYQKRTRDEARVCRKKFCQICLDKYYGESIDSVTKSDCWVCPSCRGECVCAACTRIRGKSFKGVRTSEAAGEASTSSSVISTPLSTGNSSAFSSTTRT